MRAAVIGVGGDSPGGIGIAKAQRWRSGKRDLWDSPPAVARGPFRVMVTWKAVRLIVCDWVEFRRRSAAGRVSAADGRREE